MAKKVTKISNLGTVNPEKDDSLKVDLELFEKQLKDAELLRDTFNRMLAGKVNYVDSLVIEAVDALENLKAEAELNEGLSEKFKELNIQSFKGAIERLKTVCIGNLNANANLVMS